jgi:hypothetical protein
MDKTQEKKIEVVICVPQDILIQATAWCNILLPTKWKQEKPVLVLNPQTWEPQIKVKFLFSSPKVATMFTLKFA